MDFINLQLIHRDAVSTLYFDAALPGSFVVWHGFAATADFRATCMRSLELMREKRIYKGISDARHLRVVSISDQRWFTEEFLPLVIALDISPKLYSAVIVPTDFFGRQSLDSIAEQVDDVMASQYKGIQAITRYFDTEDAAREWLVSVDAPEVATRQLVPLAAEKSAAQSQAA